MPKNPSTFSESLGLELDRAQLGTTSPSADRQDRPALVPWNQGGGLIQKTFALSALTENTSIGLGGYSVLYLSQGSDSGGRLVVNESTVLYPGSRIDGYFEDFVIRRAKAGEGGAVASSALGNAVLVVLDRPDMKYREIDFGPGRLDLLLDSQPNFADIATFGWVGSDGAWRAYANAVSFDLRPYRYLRAHLSATSLTGAGATLTLLFIYRNAYGYQMQQVSSTQTIAVGGGSIDGTIGEHPLGSATILGGAYNQTPFIALVRPLYGVFGIQSGGAISDVTGVRLLVYGAT